ncbi:hypothetical protein A3K29_04480 [Candidatus Collierbacteria bacterium RIFOXYB2_FULL_46_14]|uniref:Uncharacterized protein n=1 Tax=Candidatus Collierbacteria bacterium GW2011_GWA2_46_26 TaxID=1618381 RepID=A0A0G1PK30_9BACT|nr:MAG: hypothetical protein UX47_C0006G0135 [Candidatus Collierbacteria bacterium GW2011_GWA2_46_26]OGD73356.1 MAG: hypothetical protein A3K29_04480 [Candidatus Collierbacteria bacterium RIFOXYB2_FULL_46_14]OGD76398.1 MAG: hypothetical protein A3K43_04480 [Candidatus Collierbacteria bacterium RIFOXYA2_FULL_46_20]OGD77734.1 MAG: hypothetical protein A3K39_04480 [Candidatus Collierbacteria bacterium RIFOXYC2_FULL_43_15]OGD81024.1 MAG: hypothetical protein A2320_04975 [Pseudomonadales bacterium G
MSKRSRFIFISGIISVALWLTTTAPVDYRFGLYLVVSAVSYVLSVWVLFDDLKGIEWLTLMVLPVMFTLGSGLFANFLPTAVPSMFGRAFQLETSMLLAGLFRILYFVFYALAMYGILLIENIFSVASIRTIQLFRAARSVNFILTLVASLFFYTVALSLKLPFWWVAPMVFIVSVILSFPSFWSVDLKGDILHDAGRYSLVVSWVIAICGMALSFWPVKPFMGGLMLTSILYALLGILEQRLSSRVYLESLLEYGVTVIIIFIIGFLTTSWVG